MDKITLHDVKKVKVEELEKSGTNYGCRKINIEKTNGSTFGIVMFGDSEVEIE